MNVQILQFGCGVRAESDDLTLHLYEQDVIDKLLPIRLSRQPNLQLRSVITCTSGNGVAATSF